MTLFFLALQHLTAAAQQVAGQKLIYTARLIFHSYNLPFKNVKDNFLNLGFGFSVDYPYNKNATLFQSLSVTMLRHKEHGNAFSVNTQFSYRPLVFKALEPGISIGVGRAFTFANQQNPLFSTENGSWGKSNSQHQRHWLIPVGVSLGYKLRAFNRFTATPYVGYEAAALLKYNSAFPVLPYSSVTAGIRISHLKNL